MSEIVIRADGLGKKYRLGQRESYKTLVDTLSSRFERLGKPGNNGGASKEFWALKDVSFKIERGDIVGIIGRNGSGKSTLLKILSRITAPTEGRVEVNGRVGSLLEVGTGFHPELTGRENIFLSGSILGMRRREITDKFDDIVRFAEMEKFIDTPVKRYSSGMYVRLAFAVAAHLEPEILLLDEVLAVGDVAFQKKCLGKIDDIAHEGRTVLFVSHNMAAISSLTSKCIWLNNGALKELGPTVQVVKDYMDEGYQNVTKWQPRAENNNPMQILRAEIIPGGDFFEVKNDLSVTIDYVVREPVDGAVVSAIIHASDGAPVMSTEDIDENPALMERRGPGRYRTTVRIPGNWLSSGKYFLRLHSGVVFKAIYDNVEALSFDLIETGNPNIRTHKQAYFLPYLKWETEKL